MKIEKRGQITLEHLTTYAWTLIVIIITIGAISYFGFFDIKKFTPQKCYLSSQFKCVDFSANDALINLKLKNNAGERLILHDIIIEDDNNLECEVKYVDGNLFQEDRIEWGNSKSIDIEFAGCRGGSYIPSERMDTIIRLQYYSPETERDAGNKIIHETKGKLNVVVQRVIERTMKLAIATEKDSYNVGEEIRLTGEVVSPLFINHHFKQSVQQ